MDSGVSTARDVLPATIQPIETAYAGRLFRSRLEVAPNHVEFLGLDSMLRKIGMETEMKEKRFVDSRPKQ